MNVKLSLMLVGLFLSSLANAENKIPKLYSKLLPSVVTLHTFQNEIEGHTTKVVTSPNGLGSGVLISKDGLIVTAAHVVHLVDALRVEFSSGEVFKAKVVSSLPSADLALIKVEKVPKGVYVSKLGNSEKVVVGEQVFVIGAPLGLSRTLTVGYISGKHPVGSRQSVPMAEFFQTDASINPGNSGGPLFNMRGEVIGIASHIQTQSGGSQGLGFTVTSKTIKSLMLNRARFWSGVELLPLDKPMTKVFKLPQSNGILVQRVAEGSIAQQAGISGGGIKAKIEGKEILLGGDIILSINGISFTNEQAVRNILQSIQSVKSGQSMTVGLWRKGKIVKLTMSVP